MGRLKRIDVIADQPLTPINDNAGGILGHLYQTFIGWRVHKAGDLMGEKWPEMPETVVDILSLRWEPHTGETRNVQRLSLCAYMLVC